MDTLPVFTFYDRLNRGLGELTGWMEADVAWKWNAVGSASVTVPGIPDMFYDLAKCHRETVLARVDARRTWTGRVTDVQVRIDQDKGTRYTEVTMVDHRSYLQYLLARQVPSGTYDNQGAAEFDTRTGPAESVYKSLLADINGRYRLPIAIAAAPSPDPSPVVTVNARMDSVWELITKTTGPTGIGLAMWMYYAGDPLPPSLEAGSVAPGTLIMDAITPRNDPALNWNEDELVKGSLSIQAPGAQRVVVGYGGDKTAKKYDVYWDNDLLDAAGPYALQETYVDDAEYWKPGQSINMEKVNAKQAEMSGSRAASFEVIDGAPWTYGVDYELGDFGGGTIGGVDFRAQITEVQLKAESSGLVTYIPKMGEPLPPEEIQMARALARLSADVQADRRRK